MRRASAVPSAVLMRDAFSASASSWRCWICFCLNGSTWAIASSCALAAMICSWPAASAAFWRLTLSASASSSACFTSLSFNSSVKRIFSLASSSASKASMPRL